MSVEAGWKRGSSHLDSQTSPSHNSTCKNYFFSALTFFSVFTTFSALTCTFSALTALSTFGLISFLTAAAVLADEPAAFLTPPLGALLPRETLEDRPLPRARVDPRPPRVPPRAELDEAPLPPRELIPSLPSLGQSLAQ